MSRIGIDCRFSGTHSGLGRYTRELVTHLVSLSSDNTYVLFVRSSSEPWLIQISQNVTIVETDVPHYSIAEHFSLSRIFKSAKIDILLSPHFNVPYFYTGPFITVIHDLILHRYPNSASFLKRCAYKVLMSRTVRKAKKIIAVSNFTASEIRKFYGKPIAKKTSVVGEGVTDAFTPSTGDRVRDTLKRHKIPSPYFLYVGNCKEHKNVQRLLDAHKASGVSNQLVLVTKPESLQLHDGVTILTDVPEFDLPPLYTGATAFISASLYEGFGLPFIEARACECPVIGVSGSSVSEVIGDGSLVLDSVDALANAFRNPPSSASKDVPQWSSAAEQVLNLLQSLTS